jgi:ABC-type Fe3+/spermidine/putrescine transport system ATPase subunit
VTALSCAGLAVGYAGGTVLSGLDLAVAPGTTLALLGTSGSGKTTLLCAVAGLLRPLSGQIRLAGAPVAGPGVHVPPERRRVGMVFQDAALWPHLCARDIVAYPLRRRGLSRADARRRADGLLSGMGLSGLADRRPGALSGGEQQRVVRAQVLAEVATQRARTGAAAVHATHDPAEALAIADRVAVLDAGRLAQLDTPDAVYRRPASLTVARLTGPVSVLRLSTWDGTPAVGGVPVPAGRPAGRDLLVRPDWARLGGDLPGRVTEVRFAGPHTDYRLDTPAGELLVREPGPPRREVGATDGWTLGDAWPLPS